MSFAFTLLSFPSHISLYFQLIAISGFVECIYGLPNSTERIIEQCLNEVGCCATGCCESRRWFGFLFLF